MIEQLIRNRFFLGLIFSSIASVSAASPATREANQEIVFDQRIGTRITLTLPFVDDQGRSVRLEQLFRGRPVILALGYYECPMLCGVVLNAFVETLQQLPALEPHRDYDFLFISIDPTESTDLSAAKKRTYLKRYGRTGEGAGWSFLTGTEESIRRIAQEIGFHYRHDETSKQYVHPSGLVFLTPDGRVSSYLLGVEYPARAFQGALQLAAEKKAGSPVEQIWLLCFSHDPASGVVGSIVINALRLGAVATLIGLIVLIRYSTRHRPKGEAPHAG
jgi:protein SCO1